MVLSDVLVSPVPSFFKAAISSRSRLATARFRICSMVSLLGVAICTSLGNVKRRLFARNNPQRAL